MNLATLAQFASSLAVIVAVLFGVLQIRAATKTRELFTAAELVRTIQTTEFARAVRIVMNLPDDASPELIRGDPEVASAVLSLSHVYESLGVMVFQRVVPLHLVDQLMGGYVRRTWKKMAPHIFWQRETFGLYYGEWTQWLAEKLDEYPSPGKATGAHKAHRAWAP